MGFADQADSQTEVLLESDVLLLLFFSFLVENLEAIQCFLLLSHFSAQHTNTDSVLVGRNCERLGTSRSTALNSEAPLLAKKKKKSSITVVLKSPLSSF